MASRIRSAPLTLLMHDAVTVAELNSLLQSDPAFLSSHAGSQTGPAFDILYRSVSLRLSIGNQTEDWTEHKKIFCNLDPASVRSTIFFGLGQHVEGGERVPAIVQALLDAATKIGFALGATAVIWHPANIVSGFSYFSETVSDYLAGGAFPVLAMVNFKAGSDGIVDSKGLKYLGGQELQIIGNDMDQSELMRRVVRVVHDIAVNGAMPDGVELDGIEAGERIKLQPVVDSSMLRMTVYSNPDA